MLFPAASSPSSFWAGGDSVAVYCCWLCRVIDSRQLHSSLLVPTDLKTSGQHAENKRSTATLIYQGREQKTPPKNPNLNDKHSASVQRKSNLHAVRVVTGWEAV